eukprot:7574455-Alexandrium_andersonii.AAC.1
MLHVGRSLAQQDAADAGHKDIEPYVKGEKPSDARKFPPRPRAQSALSGALPNLLERSRFAQHGAALELTPE